MTSRSIACLAALLLACAPLPTAPRSLAFAADDTHGRAGPGIAVPPAPAVGAPPAELEPAVAARRALAPVDAGPPRYVDLRLAFPDDGTIFSDDSQAYVAGRIDAPFGAAGRVDAILVVDTSDSTERSIRPRTGRVSDRVRGIRRDRGPDASILHAELESARWMLEDVDPRDTRLGIVAFAAGDRVSPPHPEFASWTEVTLTHDLDALVGGLDRIAGRGAAGSTDIAAGLDRAVDELIGRGHSLPDPGAGKVVVFFTDGTPTHPFPEPEDNERAAIRAAERAAAFGIRVFSFAVGPEALQRPIAAVEMARRTGGIFTPVRDPRDLTTAVKSVRLAGLEELEIENVTRGRGAQRIHLGRDGTFDALVPLTPGKNVVRIRVVVAGIAAEATREVHYAPGTASPFIPPTLEERRTRLVRKGSKEVEVMGGDDSRILDAIARDRAEVERRAARQLKDLQIDVASPPPGPAGR